MLTLHTRTTRTTRAPANRIQPALCADAVQPADLPQLPEGPESDAVIGTEIMGLVLRPAEPGGMLLSWIGEHAVLVPPYTTDEVSAFQVQRTMASRGWSFRVEQEFKTEDLQYVCTFDFGVGYEASCSASTVPLAICRAAHAASRVRVS